MEKSLPFLLWWVRASRYEKITNSLQRHSSLFPRSQHHSLATRQFVVKNRVVFESVKNCGLWRISWSGGKRNVDKLHCVKGSKSLSSEFFGIRNILWYFQLSIKFFLVKVIICKHIEHHKQRNRFTFQRMSKLVSKLKRKMHVCTKFAQAR